MPEHKTIKCPFCKDGDIKIIYTERQEVSKYARAAGTTKRITYFKDPKTEALIDCPKCGKTKKELNKHFKEGTSLSTSEAVKRAKKAGLPLKF